MDDLIVLAIGRSFIELSVKHEQLYQTLQAQQREKQAVAAPAKVEVEGD